jgi:Cu(I)/Ag(I) efflux system membrane fusion protein
MEINTIRETRTRKIYYIAIGAVVIVAIALFLLLRPTTHYNTEATMTSAKNSAAETEMVSLTDEAIRRSGIGTVTVASRDFTSEIQVIGVFQIPDPAERVISARSGGRIEHMFVSSTGASVRKGDPLFEFYSPDILNAEREFITANALGMSKTGVIHTPGMDHSHSNEGLAKAGRRRLELYGLTTPQINELVNNGTVANTIVVTAPDDGLVLEKLAQEGAYVNEGTSIYQLADLSTVWAEVAVPESDIRFVRVGQLMQVSTEAYPNEVFSGRVIFISPIADQTSRSIRVRLSLPNTGYKLRPQMTFSAAIPIGIGHSLAVPASAVVRTGTADYVWVRTDNTMFTRKKITVGALSSDNYYQVVDGLASRDEIVAQGSFLIDAEYALTRSNPMAGMNMGESGNKNSGEGTGAVRTINVNEKTITLDHSTIPGVMAAMTMAYKAADPKFLKEVKVNDAVRFTLTRADNGEYLITAIQRQ